MSNLRCPLNAQNQCESCHWYLDYAEDEKSCAMVILAQEIQYLNIDMSEAEEEESE